MAPATVSLDAILTGSVQRYLTPAETIRLTVFNAATGVTVTLGGRRLDVNACVSEFTHRLVPTTDRVATVFDFTPGEGWLLGLAVRISAGAPKAGQTYAVIEVGAGAGGSFNALDVLCAGAITAAKRLGWPGSPVQGPLDGPGAIRAVAGSTPAAGADISETVPTGARWELLAFHATLTTDGTVATRVAALTLDDGTTIFCRPSAAVGQAATLQEKYSWFPGATLVAIFLGVDQQAPMPRPTVLGAGFRIRTSTFLLKPADQWSAIEYLVREWIEGA